MMRINALCERIKNSNCIIDVGSDHARLAIKLLKNKQARFVYNVEINELPLANTIRNLAKNNLLQHTCNLLNDGLKHLDQKIKQPVDYLVIAGLGAHTIVKIIASKPEKLQINKYLVISNNHPEIIRNYLKKHRFKVNYETIIWQNKLFYFLIEFSKNSGLVIKSKGDLYFGPYNLSKRTEIFLKWISSLKNQCLKNDLYLKNLFYSDLLKLLEEIN